MKDGLRSRDRSNKSGQEIGWQRISAVFPSFRFEHVKQFLSFRHGTGPGDSDDVERGVSAIVLLARIGAVFDKQTGRSWAAGHHRKMQDRVAVFVGVVKIGFLFYEQLHYRECIFDPRHRLLLRVFAVGFQTPKGCHERIHAPVLKNTTAVSTKEKKL